MSDLKPILRGPILRGPITRRFRTLPVLCTLVLGGLTATGAPPSRAQFVDPGDPQGRIGSPTVLTPSVGRYQRFEASFSVQTQAGNLQVPYDPVPVPASGAAQWSKDGVVGYLLPNSSTQGQPAFLMGSGQQTYQTTSAAEHQAFLASGAWQDAVPPFPSQGATLYLMTGPKTFYLTINTQEHQYLLGQGWRDLETLGRMYAGATDAPGTIPLYVIYNTASGDHLFTTSSYERDIVEGLGNGWQTSAGIAGYVLSAPQAGSVPLSRAYYNPTTQHTLLDSASFNALDTRPLPALIFPNEDGSQGVSVDGLFLRPGQTDWSQALVQPAFWYEGYDANRLPTGERDWRLRFAPDAVGTWQYRVRVQDAQGEALSAPRTIAVSTSTNHGFLSVSPTDSRYFRYSDGTPFLDPAASGADNPALLQKVSDSGAVGTSRAWLAATGVTAISTTTSWGDYNPDGDSFVSVPSPAGRYSYYMPAANSPQLHPLLDTTTHSYTFTTWVKLATATTSPTLVFDWYPVPDQSVPLRATTAWQQATFHIPVGSPFTQDAALDRLLTIHTRDGSRQVPAYLSGYALTEDASGENMIGNWDWVTTWGQNDSGVVDSLVLTGEGLPHEQHLSLVTFQHEDTLWGEIAPDGSIAPQNMENAVGGSTSPTADTAVLRFQRYFARYFMGRWGYSTAVLSVEHVNEGDPNDGNYLAGAQSFAAAVHADAADHRVLATTSGWHTSTLLDFEIFLDRADYPDIDDLQIHRYEGYVNGGIGALPFAGTDTTPGVGVQPTGGPGPGEGALALSPLGTQYAGITWPGSVCYYPEAGFRGNGTWTVTYQYKTSPDAAFAPGSNSDLHGPDIELWANSPDITVTGRTSPPAQVVPNWTPYSFTFTTSGAGVQGAGLHTNGALLFQALCLSHGQAYFSDVTITAPDGSTWLKMGFGEPSMLSDSASLGEYLGDIIQSASGAPFAGMPVVIGETNMVDTPAVTSYVQSWINNPTYDPQSNFLRGLAWGSIGPMPTIAEFFGANNALFNHVHAQRYYGYVQNFLAGLPVDNGRWRDVAAVSSDSGILALGQKDVTAGQAYVYAYNRQATWVNLAEGVPVAPVSGVLTVPGLADGVYTVETWDPGTGSKTGVQTLASSGGALSIPIAGLAQDVAFKLSPRVSVPASVSAPVSAPAPVLAPVPVTRWKPVIPAPALRLPPRLVSLRP
ncbi:MAG: hypothetical protein JO250_05635 [Armatimonadetes bacterium]|nr:hypothetical protein [Armatimonadota bacterium]